MSFWKKVFGGGSNGSNGSDEPKGGKPPASIPPPSGFGGDAAPDDEIIAWLEKKAYQQEAPDELGELPVGQIQTRLGRLFEAARAMALDPVPMIWGLVVPEELSKRVRAEVGPRIERSIDRWHELLVEEHGETGASLFAEIAAQYGQPARDGKIRRGRRHLTLDPSPVGADERGGVVEVAEASGYVVLEREGDVVVGARMHVDYDGPEDDPEAILEALLGDHAATLRRLTIGLWGADGDCDYGGAIAVLTEQAPSLVALEDLFIGDFVFPDETEISWATAGDASALWKALPNLRTLRLRGGGIGLGRIEHEKLRSLIVETGGLPGDAVASLAAARLPSLEKLVVWFGDPGYGAEATIDRFVPFFANTGFPKLEKLGLKNAAFTDALAEALVVSPFAPRIMELDLGMGTLTDRGAEALAKGARRFERLERLELDQAYVTAAGEALLRTEFGAKLNLGEIREAEDDGGEFSYYVSVGE